MAWTMTEPPDNSSSFPSGPPSKKLKSNDQLSDTSRALQRAIDNSGFQIFQCLTDHGYYAWNPPRGLPYMDLETVTNLDAFTAYIDLDGKPEALVDPSTLKLPLPFLSLSQDRHETKFPYGKQDAITLHVASCHRGIDFSQIDFAFLAGSALQMMATCEASDPFMVTLIPGTKTILVVKNHERVQDLSVFGFQFERLMTGRSMAGRDTNTLGSISHLQVMNVGKYRVFFRAETDALDEQGNTVEIKASNPFWWGTKVMFQMISSGSTKLCHGVKDNGNIVDISLQSLEEVANTALKHARVEELEENILKGMQSMRDQLAAASPGELFKVSFVGTSLKLSPVEGNHIFPPAGTVRQLMTKRGQA